MVKLRRNITIILTILGAVLNTVLRWLPANEFNEMLYFRGQSISFTCFILAAIIQAGLGRVDRVSAIYLTASFWLSINNLMDEVFFDPLKWGFNELGFSLIILTHAVYQYRQYKKSK